MGISILPKVIFLWRARQYFATLMKKNKIWKYFVFLHRFNFVYPSPLSDVCVIGNECRLHQHLKYSYCCWQALVITQIRSYNSTEKGGCDCPVICYDKQSLQRKLRINGIEAVDKLFSFY